MKIKHNNSLSESSGYKTASPGILDNSMDLAEFKAVLNRVFPDFNSYILRRLNMAELTGALEKSTYNASAVLNSVYRGLYRRFKNREEKIEQLKTWIYQIAEMILEETLQEKMFEQKHLMNLARLEEKELSDLEEIYTVDAEGELVLIEDLEDEVYHTQYDALAILEDETTMDQIDNALLAEDRKILHQEIRKLLLLLPEKERTVFDLFWLNEMQVEQIAEIRNLSAAKTREILERITLRVKTALEKRLKP